MLAIGATKLKLDDAVGGDEITLDGEVGGPAQTDDKTAKEVKKSLLTTLRNKFESKDHPGADAGTNGSVEEVKGNGHPESDVKVEDKDITMETPERKVARGGPATQMS